MKRRKTACPQIPNPGRAGAGKGLRLLGAGFFMENTPEIRRHQSKSAKTIVITLDPKAARLAKAWSSEFARHPNDIVSAAVIQFLDETLTQIRNKDWSNAEESSFWMEEEIARAQIRREKRENGPTR
jgi:hypothetical protein